MKLNTHVLLFVSVLLHHIISTEPHSIPESKGRDQSVMPTGLSETDQEVLLSYVYSCIDEESFDTETFVKLVENNKISYEAAKVCLEHFVCDDLYEDEDIGYLLTQFIYSHGVFDEAILGIFAMIYEKRSTNSMAFELFEVIELFGKDYGKCIGFELGRAAIDNLDLYGESYPVCIEAMTQSEWFEIWDLSKLIGARGSFDEVLKLKFKSMIIDVKSAEAFVETIPEIYSFLNSPLKWIMEQSWATPELIYLILSKPSGNDNCFAVKRLHDDRANLEWLQHVKLDCHDISEEQMDRMIPRIIEILKRDCDMDSFIAYLASLRIQFCETSRALGQKLLLGFPEYTWPPAVVFENYHFTSPGAMSEGLNRIHMMWIYLEVFGDRMSETDIDALIEFAFASRETFLFGDYSIFWVELAAKILQVVHIKSQNLILQARNDPNSAFSLNTDVTNIFVHLSQASFKNSMQILRSFFTAHGENEQLQYIEKSHLGKYEIVFLMLTDPKCGRIYKILFGKLHGKCHFFCNARRLYSINLSSLKLVSHTIAHMHSIIWSQYQKDTMDQLDFLHLFGSEDIMAHWNNVDLFEDRWMLEDIAKMVLECHERQPVSLSPASLEILRTIVKSGQRQKRTRDDEPVMELEPATKRHRHN